MIFLLIAVEAMKVSTIPQTGTPPDRRYDSSGVFDSDLNQLISFGGYDYKFQSLSSSLHSFNLSSNTWSEIPQASLISPPPLSKGKLCIRSDRKLFYFFGETSSGFSSDVFSFDLSKNSWEILTLSGDPISRRVDYSLVQFIYLNREYAAIFGGVTPNGKDNDLFL